MDVLLKSNFRFLKAFLPLNLLKVVSNVIGITFFTYFWMIKVNGIPIVNFLKDYQSLLVLLLVAIITCIGYNLIQFQTISYRLKELFIWKWFGIPKRRQFWLFFIEHFLVTFFSAVVAIVIFDTFFNLFTSARNVIKYNTFDVLTPILTVVILLTIFGLWQIFKLMRMNKQEVFNKLSNR